MYTEHFINKQFSKEHLSSVLEALIKVKGGEIKDVRCGICRNSMVLVNNQKCNTYNIIADTATKFSKYSGYYSYPIPYRGANKWIGEYGQLRYELLDFLIEELTKAVEGYDND